MSNQTYQLIVNNICVGTWLQTLLFYSFLGFLYAVIIVQTRTGSSKLSIDMLPENEDIA